MPHDPTRKTALFDEAMSEKELIPFLTMNAMIAISNVTINSLLIFAIKKLKKYKTISYKFIICLSISDISVGILQLVYIILRSLMKFYDTAMVNTMELCMETLFYLPTPFSGVMILIIAVDRYIHMKYLLKYNEIMTKRRARMIVCMNIIFQCITAVSLLLSSLKGYYSIQQPVLVVGYILIMTAIVVLYFGAYRSIKRRTRNSSIGVELPELPKAYNSVQRFSNDALHRRRYPDRKLSDNLGQRTVSRRYPDDDFLRSMLYILLSLAICHAPFLILTATRSLMLKAGHDISHTMMSVLLWTYNLNFCLSTLNAGIFISCNRDLKSYVKTLFGWAERRRSQLEDVEMFTSKYSARKITVLSHLA